jgi:hypothetical protein
MAAPGAVAILNLTLFAISLLIVKFLPNFTSITACTVVQGS